MNKLTKIQITEYLRQNRAQTTEKMQKGEETSSSIERKTPPRKTQELKKLPEGKMKVVNSMYMQET